MTKRYYVYKCEVCGNIVQVMHAGVGTLVCCNKSMTLLKEKTEDEGSEKHLPVIERTEDGIKVSIGSIQHPMEENHYIEWIEIIADGNIYRTYLHPGDKPELIVNIKAEQISAREYCTIHGLWQK